METNVIAANLDNKSEALSVSGQWTTRIRLLQVLKDMDKSVTDKSGSDKRGYGILEKNAGGKYDRNAAAGGHRVQLLHR
ncbi:hypothetical protein YC2023_060112 [Brassica napus]